jgi:NitT/TauT family transport system substrate-binding protein
VAACGGSSGSGSAAHLALGLTYIPDIQFAPFYVAAAKGYYKDAGLDVSFHHGIETNEFALLAAGKEDAIFAGGDEVLEARAHGGLALVDVATIYQKYPVSLIVPANSPIQTSADLRGHTIGVPGPYGATYTGLLALLHSAGLTTSDVHVQSIGFNQIPELIGHKVDAVMGYSNNEPIHFQQMGFAIRTIDVWTVQPLVSNGLVALQSELRSHPSQVRALVSATLRGVQYASAHPQDAVNISKAYVPDLGQPDKAATALAVLQATIPIWQGAGRPGYNDPASWQGMTSFLVAVGLLSGSIDENQAYSNSYLPA